MAWFEKLQISVINADIFFTEADVIVIPVTTTLGSYGGISREFFGRYKISKIGLSTKKPDETGHLALGEAGPPQLYEDSSGRRQNFILCALWQRENPYTLPLIYSFYINSLRAAFAESCKSIALPILNVDPSLLSTAVAKVLTDLNNLRNSDNFSIEQISFVSRRASHVDLIADMLIDEFPIASQT